MKNTKERRFSKMTLAELTKLRNEKESELQDKIARENGIDLDFSCDICVFDYEQDYKKECKEIAKLDKLIEGETK